MMYYLAIQGKQKLSGSVSISGAKNAALPLLALTLLSKRKLTISNIPEVADVKTLLQLLSNLGATFAFTNKNCRSSRCNHSQFSMCEL